MAEEVQFGERSAVDAIWCGRAKLDGANCNQGCFCADGAGYTIKTADPDPRGPHNEWLCSHLAARAGLLGPAFKAIKHTDGNVWFGSAWVTGEIKQWWQQVLDGKLRIAELSSDLSKIFVFDLFIHNTDRRLSNFLVKKDGRRHRAYSLDYSSAWLHHGFPPPPLPLAGYTNTMIAHRILRATCGDFFAKPEAIEALDRLGSVTAKDIGGILKQQPKSWLTAEEKNAVIDWWDSGRAKSRIDVIRDGIGNGAIF
jgi:hypothetical protein